MVAVIYSCDLWCTSPAHATNNVPVLFLSAGVAVIYGTPPLHIVAVIYICDL